MNQKLRKFIDFLVIIAAIGGFSYQAWLFCYDYFKYTTTTTVSIFEALAITTFPKIAVCVPYFNDNASTYVAQFQYELMESRGEFYFPTSILLNPEGRNLEGFNLEDGFSKV